MFLDNEQQEEEESDSCQEKALYHSYVQIHRYDTDTGKCRLKITEVVPKS